MIETPEKLLLLNDAFIDDAVFSRIATWTEYAPKVSSPYIRFGFVVGFSVLSLGALSSLPWYMTPVGWIGMAMCFFGLHAIASSCSNDSLAPSTHVNRLFGWLCSLFTLTAYESWNVQRKKFFSERTHTHSITLWLSEGDFWMWTSLVSWIMNSFFPQRMPGMHAQKKVVANVVTLYCLLLVAALILWRTGVTAWPTLKFYFIPLVLFHLINSAMIRFQINNDPSAVLSAMKARAEQMNLGSLSPYQLRQLFGEANAYLRSNTYPAWIRWMNLVFGVDVMTTLSEDALAFCSNPLSFIPEFGQKAEGMVVQQTNTALSQLTAEHVQSWLTALRMESVLPDLAKYPHVVDGALLAEVQCPEELEMIPCQLLRRKLWKFLADANQNGVNMELMIKQEKGDLSETTIVNTDDEEPAEACTPSSVVEGSSSGLLAQLNQAKDEIKGKDAELLTLRTLVEQDRPHQALQVCVEALELGLSRAVQAAENYREEVLVLQAKLAAEPDVAQVKLLQGRVEALELGLMRAVAAAETYRAEVLQLQTQLSDAQDALSNKQQECESYEMLKCALEACLERTMSTAESYRQEIAALRQLDCSRS